MTVIYGTNIVVLDVLQGKRVCLIGYGSLGRPIAPEICATPELIWSSARARTIAGISPIGRIERGSRYVEAVKGVDVIILMLPDEVMHRFIWSRLACVRRGQALIFSSAYNVAYRFIAPLLWEVV